MPEPFWNIVPFSCTKMSDRDLHEEGHDGKNGYRYVTVYAMPSKMLPFLMKQFHDRGGKVINSKVKSLDELSGYDVIINCSGIGARELVGDENIIPVRGQVIKVAAPGVKNAKFSFPGTYVIPNDEAVVLGGTAQRGDWRLATDDSDTAAILDRCRRWIPSLRDVPVQRIWLDAAEQNDIPKGDFVAAPTAEIVDTLTSMFEALVEFRGMDPDEAQQRLARTPPFDQYPEIVAEISRKN